MRPADGSRISCVVERVEHYGVWARTAAFEGRVLMLIPEISWGRIRFVSDHYAAGDVFDAQVLAYIPQTGNLAVSVKVMTPDPWQVHAAQLKVGRSLRGRVLSVVDYGAFIECFTHIEGLLPTPGASLAIGDEIDVVLTRVDMADRRIELAMLNAPSSASTATADPG